MSKMGNLYIELTEQANELGFESVEEALSKGYEVVHGELQKKEDEQAKAHEAWLKEKEIVLGILRIDADTIDRLNDTNDLAITRTWVKSLGSDIKKAIEFIETGEQ